jgi:tagatose-1,6-bisphosphate aldolase non-catalytic subunit AgaZ/GatZ
VLVAATSNRVDGYPGMEPSDFRDLVFGTAKRTGTVEVARS